MLATIGDLVEDIVARLSRDPRKGTDTPTKIQRRRGGSAANVAALARAIGTPSRFVGQVGDDPLGQRLIDDLTQLGVDARVSRSGVTGSIIVLVDSGGERTFLTDRGAALNLSSLDDDILKGVEVLHVPLYSVLTGPLARTTFRLLGDAIDAEVMISLDLSSVAAIEEFGPAELLALVEHLKPVAVFGNQSELEALAVEPGRAIAGSTVTIVKAGPDPTTVLVADRPAIAVRVRPVEEVSDTTGAGDGFAAGYLTAIMAGSSPRTSVEAGHRLAALVLASPGASLPDSFEPAPDRTLETDR
ncbi:MAG: PfkB family carbohydrate kinase [Acidimicrobiales bacterium]